MKHYFIIIIFCCCCWSSAQTINQNNYPEAFLIGAGAVVYYNAIGNKPIFFIDNSSDDFYQLSLIKKRTKRYYVKIQNLSSSESHVLYGWINRSAAGVTFSSEKIELFKCPRNTSECIKLTVPIGSVLVQILNFRKNGWMRISFYLNNSYYIGWLPSKYQCSNYFTMCCGN